MAKRSIEESTLTALGDVIRRKTGKTGTLTPDGTMVSALETLEDVTYPLADEPTAIGQAACLARAAQMRDIKWTLQGNLTMTGGSVYQKGRVVTGLPYSSVRKTDRFVGFNISLYTFMTAVHNPRSLLYTTTAADNTADNGNIANLYYGINCSVLGSYAHDWNYHTATNAIPELPYIEEVDPADMQLCDLPNASKSHGGSIGHCTMVTGITRNADGSINTLELTESTQPVAKATTMTYESFISNYINGLKFKVYRDTRLYEAGYKASPFVRVFDEEPVEEIVYSKLCTNRGDKVSITEDEIIILNVLIDSGYETIKVYKDGALYDKYTVSNGDIVNGDLSLTGLPAGMYTAVLCDSNGAVVENAGTSFEICDVEAFRYKNYFYFRGSYGVPVRVVFKDSGGYTLSVFDLTDDDIAKGYAKIEGYTGATPAQVCVPFKTAFGFVVAKFNYAVETEPDELPDASDEPFIPVEYQQVEYIETDGHQYIDTGVIASDYPENITYDMRCVITGRTGSGKADYYWGASDGTNRSGYVGMANGTVVEYCTLWLYAGTTGNELAIYTAYFNIDQHLVLTLSAKHATAWSASGNGKAFTSSGKTAGNGTQPNLSIWLFAANGISDANGNRRFKGKCYSFSMTYEDGTPIRNFVPCYRKADGVIGLYDTVGGQFYTNAGTGSFTKGADV